MWVEDEAAGRSETGGTAPAVDAAQPIGSVTKTFVAVITMQLVAEGRVELEAPAGDLVADLSLGGGCTLDALLRHETDLATYTDALFWRRVLAEPDRPLTPIELLEHAAARDTTGAGYCNTNYVVVGLVLESLTSQTLAGLVRRRVADPLGLERTFLPGPTDLTAAADHPGKSTIFGHDGPVWPTAASVTGSWAAGGMTSTLDDLRRLGAALRDGELLDPVSSETMFTCRNGRGLGVAAIADGLIGHTGGIPGYRAVLGLADGRVVAGVASDDAIDIGERAARAAERDR